MPRERKIQYQRTISQELHTAWLKLKRKGDSAIIAEKLDLSRPVIDRALLYGYVAQVADLPDQINKFFFERMEAEKSQAKKLTAMADSLAK